MINLGLSLYLINLMYMHNLNYESVNVSQQIMNALQHIVTAEIIFNAIWLWSFVGFNIYINQPKITIAAQLLWVPACHWMFPCTPVNIRTAPLWTSPRDVTQSTGFSQDRHIFGQIERFVLCKRTASHPITMKEAGQTSCRPFCQWSSSTTETKWEKKSHHYPNPSNGGGPGRWSLVGKWKERLQANDLAQVKGEGTKVVSTTRLTNIEVIEVTAVAVWCS